MSEQDKLLEAAYEKGYKAGREAADRLADAVSDWFTGRPDGDDLHELVAAYREVGDE